MTKMERKIIVRCPKCKWRIMDKATPTSGVIEIKCPNCRNVVQLDLSLRKAVHYRRITVITTKNN